MKQMKQMFLKPFSNSFSAQTFRRICNPPAMSIRISNPLSLAH